MHTLSSEQIGTRNELRRSALARRDALSDDVRQSANASIIGALREHLKEINARFIHCYISFRSEVRTREFIEQELAEGMKIVVPVVEELDGREHLVHTEIHGLHDLRQGRFGLDEPHERTPASLENLHAVILPLAAFDRTGTRLGYGKGFYDQFLSDVRRRVPRIGLAFAVQEVDAIPRASHDAPLDLVITERGIIRCS